MLVLNHYCFFGNDFSDKYEQANRTVFNFTGKDPTTYTPIEVKLSTSESRKYKIKICHEAKMLSFLLLNPLSYDTSVIKYLINLVPRDKLLSCYNSDYESYCLFIHNINFLSSAALNLLKGFMEKFKFSKLLICTSENNQLVRSVFNKYGSMIFCKQTCSLISQFKTLQLEETETWKIIVNQIAEKLSKCPNFTSIEQMRIKMLDLWVSNIPFTNILRQFLLIWNKMGIKDEILFDLVSVAANLDHQVNRPHYHIVMFFDNWLSTVVRIFDKHKYASLK